MSGARADTLTIVLVVFLILAVSVVVLIAPIPHPPPDPVPYAEARRVLGTCNGVVEIREATDGLLYVNCIGETP